MRNLILIFGDQLDRDSAVFDEFDSDRDAIWMAEVDEEATHVWCHKLRIAFFFAALRHFRDDQLSRGRTVHYTELPRRPSDDRGKSFADVLRKDIHIHHPERLVVVRPGDHRVLCMIQSVANEQDVELELREDRHFYGSVEDFNDWADQRHGLVLENFYRDQRRRFDVLMQEDGSPTGGSWNFDADNRESFGRDGPPMQMKAPRRFRPDDTTRAVVELVEHRFADHPGSLDHFDLPVNRDDALALLRDFVEHRLPDFGTWEDAMWTDEAFLFHSRLSAAMNVKLISPRECVDKAVAAYDDGDAPLNSVEGFVRQILGWREFVRGVYWRHMPDYLERNALDCDDREVPESFWTGETDMRCVAQSMKHVVNHGYSHHIHRLMVLGLFAQLLGVHPRKFHDWHMAMYLDAIDWVSLPNTLGMSQFGDGGIVGTKPYCASGNYISKMSPFCRDCRYKPKQSTGDNACPMSTLYWDFLARHEKRFDDNPRMNFQLANLRKKQKSGELKEIRNAAKDLIQRIDAGDRI